MSSKLATTSRRAAGRVAVLAPLTMALTLGVSVSAFAASSPHASASGAMHSAASPSPSASSHVTQGTSATVGDPTMPQPLSTADVNAGGANGQCSGTTATNGIYCSTRDGSPSPNGNGGGQATGKPCMGCVGKADNKNPPGQETSNPLGTFPNNGYECDHNNGVGKGNPAHTSCTSTTTTVTTCPNGHLPVNGTCTPTQPPTTCPSGQTLVNGTCTPTQPPTTCPTGQTLVNGTCTHTTPPAGGTTSPGTTCVGGQMSNGACVLGEKFVQAPKSPSVQAERVLPRSPTSVLGKRIVRTPNVVGTLPFTGADTRGLLAIAALMVAAGLPLLVIGRRRHAHI